MAEVSSPTPLIRSMSLKKILFKRALDFSPPPFSYSLSLVKGIHRPLYSPPRTPFLRPSQPLPFPSRAPASCVAHLLMSPFPTSPCVPLPSSAVSPPE